MTPHHRQFFTALALLMGANACIESPSTLPPDEGEDMAAEDMASEDIRAEDMALDAEDMRAEDMPTDAGDEADADITCIPDEEFSMRCTADTCGEVFDVCDHGQRTCACEVKFATIEGGITSDWSTAIRLALDETTVITPAICASTGRDACRACEEATWTPLDTTEDILRTEPVDEGPSRRVTPHGAGTLEVDSVCDGEVMGTLELEVLAPEFHTDALNLWLRAGYGYQPGTQTWEAAAPAKITMESDAEVMVSANMESPATLSLSGHGGWYDAEREWNLDAPEATIVLVVKNDKNPEELSILARRCGSTDGDIFTIGYGVPNNRRNAGEDYREGSHRWLNIYNKAPGAPDEHDVHFDLPGTAARPHVLTITLNGPGVAPEVYQNGQEAARVMGENSSADYFEGGHLLDRLFGSCSPMNTNDNFVGEVGEVLIYDRALTKAEREAIERYLGRKHDISLTP